MVNLKELERFQEVYITYNKTLEDISDISDFISEEVKKVCIEKNQIWVLKIHSFVPSISYTIAGSNIEELINYMLNKIHEGWV